MHRESNLRREYNMAINFNANRVFEPKGCRHLINDDVYVLHCHHYVSLYTQLAEDCGMLDGKKLLSEVSEDTFYDVLSKYFADNKICCINDKVSIAEQYYTFCGLGKIKLSCIGIDGGEAKLCRSHVDEGWIKKWGKKDKPINFITCGYIAAAFSAILGKPARAYEVCETQSIVTGAEYSKFEAVVK
jgi:predicted hydrocarbon binding protein